MRGRLRARFHRVRLPGSTLRGLLHGVNSDLAIEALKRHFSEVLKGQTFAYAQLSDDVRYQALLRLGVGAKSRRELNR
jgi:hypothetical protein